MTPADAHKPSLPQRLRLLLLHWPQVVLWAGLGVSAGVLAEASEFSRNHALLINVSPSLPYWAVWLDRGKVPQRGDLVLFDPPSSELLTRHFGAKPQMFGKRVLGTAGDLVTEKKRLFFVNGQPVAFAKPTSRSGEALALGPTGTIPEGCYFVATDHKDSFDSRYAAIGWICRPQVLGVGSPVL